MSVTCAILARSISILYKNLKCLVNIIDNIIDPQQPNIYDEDADHVDIFPNIQRKERRLLDQSLRRFSRQMGNLRRSAGWIGDDLVQLWPRGGDSS